jgi:hypothetical protein
MDKSDDASVGRQPLGDAEAACLAVAGAVGSAGVAHLDAVADR